jgi:Fe-S cluster biogenesis protein NfuA
VEAVNIEQPADHALWFKPRLMKRMVSADPLRPRLQRQIQFASVMDAEDLVAMYAAQAKSSLEKEAEKRLQAALDPEEEERLRNLPLADAVGTPHLVPALLARLGPVRAALDGHGGGIQATSCDVGEDGLDLVLDLTGACVSCGAAPGTLQGIKGDLEGDHEVERVRFDAVLLDSFDDLGRDFILAHGEVEFVTVEVES